MRFIVLFEFSDVIANGTEVRLADLSLFQTLNVFGHAFRGFWRVDASSIDQSYLVLVVWSVFPAFLQSDEVAPQYFLTLSDVVADAYALFLENLVDGGIITLNPEYNHENMVKYL